MIYTGFYIISALFVINKLSTFSKINLGIIMGLMIPDLDILFKYLNFNNDFHGGAFHSIFFSTLIFICLLIISEFNNKLVFFIVFTEKYKFPTSKSISTEYKFSNVDFRVKK